MSEFVFSVGCDPELFVEDKGRVISSHGLVRGTKTEPFPTKNGFVQVDGTALEFNTRPAVTEEEFSRAISDVMNDLRALIPSELKYSLRTENLYDKEYFDALPDEVKELGCNPDYNAWTEDEQVIVEPIYGMRTTSGHVHIGWTGAQDPMSEDMMRRGFMLAKQLDHSLGLYSVINEQPNTRRMMYGQAGSFRPTSYGMEYRVPSNFYVFNDNHRRNVFRLVQKAGNDLISGNPYYEDTDKNEAVCKAINEDDKEACGLFFERYVNG